MYKEKKVVALIAAAGMGERMNSSTPKQFIEIGNETIVEKSTEAFENSASVDCIYMITKREYMDELSDLLTKKRKFSKVSGVIEGGKSRQESVHNGLKALPEDTDIVLIHDAARPYVSSDLIEKVVAETYEKKAVIPAVPVKDTVKIVDGNVITNTPKRDTLFAAQTPQGFHYDLIKEAHERAAEGNYVGTDDAGLVEHLGENVYITMGEDFNIKITTPTDLPAEDMRVGIGFDVHAFSENRDLILGGLKIPYEKGLLGHSDADVLTHALMDAILGALNLGDIGTNFPDNDVTYKDISSIILLEKVTEMMKKRGFKLKNADLVIVAEKPKMKDFIPEIREILAKSLNSHAENISVKATTTEGLGFTGREEGIGSQAIVQLIKER